MSNKLFTNGIGVFALIVVTSFMWVQVASASTTFGDEATNIPQSGVTLPPPPPPADPLSANGGTNNTTKEESPIRDVITTTKLLFYIYRNQLLVYLQDVTQSITDFMTGDKTTVHSQTYTSYQGDVAVSQTGYSTQDTESVNGKSHSDTTLTFEKDGLGSFRVGKQTTYSTSREFGSCTETDLSCHTVTSQTTEITREYGDSGRLTNADGKILYGYTTANGGYDYTTFSGDLDFQVCAGVNAECLTKQSTTSHGTNYLDGTVTDTVSVLNQETDLFGRILSGQAVADSHTTDAVFGEDRRSDAHSVTNFVVSDLNSLAAYQTMTDTTSVDLTNKDPQGNPLDGTVTHSTQQVIIELQGVDVDKLTNQASTDDADAITGEVTGRVLDAHGVLSSIGGNVHNNGDGTYTELANVAGVDYTKDGVADRVLEYIVGENGQLVATLDNNADGQADTDAQGNVLTYALKDWDGDGKGDIVHTVYVEADGSKTVTLDNNQDGNQDTYPGGQNPILIPVTDPTLLAMLTERDGRDRITNTNGSLEFDVFFNNIQNTATHIEVVDQNFVDNIATLTTQDILQNFNELGVGTTGTTTVKSETNSAGAVDIKFDPVTQKYIITPVEDNPETPQNEAENNNATHSEALTQINTVFVGGQFRATDIISGSVSFDTVNNEISISLTETRQVYNSNGSLLNGIDANNDGDYSDPGDQESFIKSNSRSSTTVGLSSLEIVAPFLFDGNGELKDDAENLLIAYFFNADLSEKDNFSQLIFDVFQKEIAPPSTP